MATLFQESVRYVKSKLAGNPAYEPENIKEEQERLVDFRKLYDFYIFDRQRVLDYVKIAMKATFKATTIAQMQFPLYNLTKKIINQLAVAYLEPATRYVVVPKATQTQGTETIQIGDKKAEQDNDIYQEILALSNINSASKDWNRLAKLLTTVYVGVMYREGKIEYELFPPHSIEVKAQDDDYLEPALVQYDRKFGKETLTYVWTPTEHRIVDKDNRMVESLNPWVGVNKYGVIPFLPCRLSVPGDHWGEGDTELVSVNEKIDILIASMVYNAIMQSHSQPFGVNLHLDDREAGELQTGPGRVIEVNDVSKEDALPSFEFVTPQPAIEANVRAIDWMLKALALSKGLSAQSVSPEVSESSGVSKMVDLNELRERRRDDVEFLRPFEKRLFDITRIVWNTNEEKQISDDAVFGIDFVEPELPMTAKEELEIKEKKMALGLYSPVQDMCDEDEGIDEEQAMAYIMKNMQWNQMIQKARGNAG